jgi:hypothetical protein
VVFVYLLQLVQKKSTFSGILSDNSTNNPTFYNWNRLQVFYCDGGSFAGDRSDVYYNATFSLNFHGQRILRAVIAELYRNWGFSQAKNILLTGCSAGGQAVSMALTP